ncbi:MAG: hypothetical protein RLZZ628_303 [Bacteroidota bacterium]|jgi:hypothetical protein
MNIAFPLNEIQTSLLRLTQQLSEEELKLLKRVLIEFKAQRVAFLADKAWRENGWTEETMSKWLNTHLRTPYLAMQKRKL